MSDQGYGHEQEPPPQSDATVAAYPLVATGLSYSFNTFKAALKAVPQQVVADLQQSECHQDLNGLRVQIIANTTVLYPIIAEKAAMPPPYIQIPDFFVITTGMDTAIQAFVLQPEGGALNLPPGNDTIHKDVIIKGPTAWSTKKALEGLLHYTEKVLSDNWGYMRNPPNQQTAAGPNGAWHYRR